MSMCNCFTCDCKCSKCVLLLLWHVYVCVTCSFVSVCVSLMRLKGLSGHVRLCMHSFFFVHKCVRVCICFVYVGGYVDPHGHGSTRNIVRYLVSNGIRGSAVSLMVLYKEMIIL